MPRSVHGSWDHDGPQLLAVDGLQQGDGKAGSFSEVASYSGRGSSADLFLG